MIAEALADLAASGIVLADERWVRYALERRRRRLPAVAARRRAPAARLDVEQVRAQLARHAARAAPLPLDLLLEPPPPPAPVTRDVLGAAGLPSTLLVPDETLARLLRAHDLQLETGAAVLAMPAAELPAWLRDGIARAGDGARVLALHDASVPALAALDRLEERLGLPTSARLIAVGMRPAQAAWLRLHAVHGPAPAREDVRRAAAAVGLRPAEARWLASGRSAEIASMAPDALLRALRRLLLGRPSPARARLLPPRAAGFV